MSVITPAEWDHYLHSHLNAHILQTRLWGELNSKFERQEFSIQPRRSILLSLEGSEEEMLGRMKQKTRYNIRLAQKKEITVESSQNIKKFLHLMKITGERNQ